MYRPRNTDINKFNEELCTVLESARNKTMYVCVDFNVDLLKFENHPYTQDFVNQLF